MPQTDLFFIDSLASLYQDVQMREVFADSKYFVDCIPNGSPAAIISSYEQEKRYMGFNLKNFVTEHFVFPAEIDTHYTSANKPILQHLNDLWDTLTRKSNRLEEGTLINLPYTYVVPGGRFREVYYWDSYFTMLGLQVNRRVDLIQNMVANFAYLIDAFGHIPNGNRSYYLSRSQPPFFTLMVELLAEEKNGDILLQYLPQIEREYAFWMDGEETLNTAGDAYRRVVKLPDGHILNRYWDDKDEPRPEAYAEDRHIAKEAGGPAATVYRHIRAAAESGWDFSSRWFKDPQKMTTIQTTDLVPVDLNCLLLHIEETLLKIYTLQKQPAPVELFTQKILNRKKAIQQYCWNENKGFYFDYHFKDNITADRFTLAALYPLFFSVADSKQAQQVARVAEESFLQTGGLLTTIYKTGQQWDAPNGWAPLQWIAFKGLKQYGYTRLAGEIKNRWMATNEKVYAETGKMMEKYNVADTNVSAGGGEYPNQDGFGWSNGVYLAFTLED